MANEDITKPEPLPPALPKQRRRRTDSKRVRALHWGLIISALAAGGWEAYEAAHAKGVAGVLVMVPVVIGILSRLDVARGK